MEYAFKDMVSLSTMDVRKTIRAGHYKLYTAGLGAGKLQANLAIMSECFALDFLRYCQRNPKPCPLVGVSDTGNPMMHTLGHDIDIRTDVPAYFIYEYGELTESAEDIRSFWKSNFVAFALGCSFTFEHALMAAGVPLWHIDNTQTVPMFRSNIQTVPAGPFGGSMVVSMRAINKNRIEEVSEISSRFPLAHGAPIHWGCPEDIGINDINLPDWGDASPIGDEQIPVFWACGVTPQVALEQAKLPICITHKPGHMLITDVDDNAETPIVITQDSLTEIQHGD